MQIIGFRRAKQLTVGMVYLRQNMRKCLQLLKYERVIALEKNGKTQAVLMSAKEYRRLMRQRHILINDLMDITEYDYEDG